jgi:riboflavin kinase / FMN adenylyltransferase
VRILTWEAYVDGGLPGISCERPFAATIGVFDGLHIGHQELIKRILGRSGLDSVVLTFKENPKRILSPHTHPGELSTLDQKLELIESMSVDFCVLIDFSGDFSKLPGRRFLSILKDRGRLGFLAVGSDFRCGRGLDTGASDIRSFCEEFSVGIELVESIRWAGYAVSSSRIRKAIIEGRLEDAQAMLGRPYEIDLRGAVPSSAGLWAPKGAQARPPRGIYDARLAFGSGSAAFPVSARLDATGLWTFGLGAEGSFPRPGAEPRGLGLIRMVSRE